MRNGDIMPFEDPEQGTKSFKALIAIHDNKAKKAALVGDIASVKRNRARAQELATSLELKTIATKRRHGGSEKS